MRYAIVGSRHYPDLEQVREFVRSLSDDIVVVTGGALGVDAVAEDEARKRGLEVVVYKAEWTKYGRSAGMIRNREIVNNCDKLIAFWDGESPGTKNSISRASKTGKLLHVYRPKNRRQTELF